MDKNLFDYSIEWKPFTSETHINKNAVHIFKVPVDKYYPQIRHLYQSVLSRAEIAKAARFINIKDTEAVYCKQTFTAQYFVRVYSY